MRQDHGWPLNRFRLTSPPNRVSLQNIATVPRTFLPHSHNIISLCFRSYQRNDKHQLQTLSTMSLIQYLHDTWVAIVHGITKPVPILMALFDGHLPFSTIFYNAHKPVQSSITTQEKPQLDGRMDPWEPELEMVSVEWLFPARLLTGE
jgi:hypothetical protein